MMEAPDVVPKKNSAYGSRDYWEDRFSKESVYEWLLSYRQLAGALSRYLTVDSRILVVGCGNAPFSMDLYDAGYHDIVNIDYATSVIERMHEEHSSLRPGMKWLVMDMTQLTFEDDSFDVIIDKAAMDAMLADEGDVWNPNEHSIQMAWDACRSLSRVLRPGGVCLQISLVQPHFRKKYLLGWHRKDGTETRDDSYSKDFGWSLRVEGVGNDESNASSFGHFLYIMTKLDENHR